MNSRLELNTNVLKDKEQNYTSLTELNQLRLFTRDFEAVIENKKIIAEKEENDLINNCFLGNSEGEPKDTVISSMFYMSQKIVVEERSQPEKPDHYFLLSAGILLGLLICTLVFEITSRGGTRRHDADIDDRTEEPGTV